MLTQRVVPLVSLAAALFGAAGCADEASPTGAGADAVAVVASTNVYGDIASQVGGDRVEITAFISSPGQDPHSFEASGRDILAVSKAGLVIENGGGYDDFMDRLIDSAGGDATVLNVADEVGLDDSADTFNEHIWYDLGAMQKAADAIASALTAIDAQHADEYRTNAEEFDARLQALVDREQELRKQLEGTRVAVTEPVPGYMLDALGLVDMTPSAFSRAIEEGDDVAVSVLAQTLDLFTNHEVAALVYNAQTTGPVTDQAKAAAEDAGIAVVAVTEVVPAGSDYVEWMRSNLDALDTALQ